MSLVHSSGRWRTRYASAVRCLSAHHALKPLVASLVLLVVVIYGLGDKLRNFVASIFIPQYRYPYPVALNNCLFFYILSFQVLVSLLFLNLLHALDLVHLRSYSRSLGERMLPSAICSSIQAVLTMWARASSSSSNLFVLMVLLLPLVTVAFSFALKLASPPAIFSFCLSAASEGLLSIVPLEYIYGPLALILHSLSLTWLAKVSEMERSHPPDSQASVFDIYYTQLVNQSWVLGLLWCLHPERPWHVLSQANWRSLLFHGYLLAILLLGMVLSFLVGVVALCCFFLILTSSVLQVISVLPSSTLCLVFIYLAAGLSCAVNFPHLIKSNDTYKLFDSTSCPLCGIRVGW
uniref:Si:ch211-207n2.7 n=1 Tax=Haplochromis burtoni TaxID=8153 RepID=A0A3Q2VQB0_HAPBU